MHGAKCKLEQFTHLVISSDDYKCVNVISYDSQQMQLFSQPATQMQMPGDPGMAKSPSAIFGEICEK